MSETELMRAFLTFFKGLILHHAALHLQYEALFNTNTLLEIEKQDVSFGKFLHLPAPLMF
jgi:hypothetical protein